MDAFLLISVGELNINKNHSVVIKALEQVDNASIHYIIAGKGELNNQLNDLAIKLGIASQIHLIGYRSDIPTLYAASDVCMFPSIREGLGIAAIEAMASGLPIIVSDNRGARDFVSENNGITVKYDDAIGFEEGIKIMHQNYVLCRQMGMYNVKTAKQFDVSVVNIIMRVVYDAM